MIIMIMINLKHIQKHAETKNEEEITEYTKMLAESREQTLSRMIQEAENKDADGIVCLHFAPSAVIH